MLQRAGVNITIAILLFVGAGANMMYVSENTRILANVITLQHGHSMFATSDIDDLCISLRRVRDAEVATAVSPL